MNEYLSEIYAAAQGDIDPEVAAAGALLSKIAAEEGVDLDDYTEGEVAGMLSEIMEGEEEKISGYIPTEITVADVSAELSKVAAAEGVDLSELSREEYHNAYNWMHDQMTDPYYMETKVAMQEKVAEADMLGRVMAHSFNDELEKMATVDQVIDKGLRRVRAHGRLARINVKAQGRAANQALEHYGNVASDQLGRALTSGAPIRRGTQLTPEQAETVMRRGRKALTAIKGTAAVGGVGGAGYLAHQKYNK